MFHLKLTCDTIWLLSCPAPIIQTCALCGTVQYVAFIAGEAQSLTRQVTRPILPPMLRCGKPATRHHWEIITHSHINTGITALSYLWGKKIKDESCFLWDLVSGLPSSADASGRPWEWLSPLWGSGWSGYHIYRTLLLLQSTTSICLAAKGHLGPQLEKRQVQKQGCGLVGNGTTPKVVLSRMWKGKIS